MTRDRLLEITITLGHLYQRANAAAGEQMIVAIVACPACRADVDVQCTGQYQRRTASMHADRRTAAIRVRKAAPDVYEKFRADLLRSLLKDALAAIKVDP